jgi:hypothetical protein
MSPPGRPKGEYRSAKHEGTPVNPARPPEVAHSCLAGPAAGPRVHQ